MCISQAACSLPHQPLSLPLLPLLPCTAPFPTAASLPSALPTHTLCCLSDQFCSHSPLHHEAFSDKPATPQNRLICLIRWALYRWMTHCPVHYLRTVFRLLHGTYLALPPRLQSPSRQESSPVLSLNKRWNSTQVGQSTNKI